MTHLKGVIAIGNGHIHSGSKMVYGLVFLWNRPNVTVPSLSVLQTISQE